MTLRDQPGLAVWHRNRGAARAAAGFDTVRNGVAASRNVANAQEHARQRVIGRLNRQVSKAASASQARAFRLIERLDGRVDYALPVPNVVYATVPARRLGELRRSPQVQAVEELAERTYLGVAQISGADAWHAAGCTGAGAADATCPTTIAPRVQTGPTDGLAGHGGPDVAVDDMSINDHHWAFTGGPTPSLGRSPSITVPPCATDLNGDDPGRTHGSPHASTIAAIIATKQPDRRGVAYGVDTILDPAVSCIDSAMWLLGLPWGGQPGIADLPESWNKSYSIDDSPVSHTTDDAVYDREADLEASKYGIGQAIAAGNDGPYAPLGNTLLPYDSPGSNFQQARVAHPCVAYNAICMGAVTNLIDTNHANDTVEKFSSRGPTAGGRKKPDLVAFVGSGWGCPNSGYGTYDSSYDTFASGTGWKSYAICGEGTSYSAPFGAGAQLLLAGVGVTSPMAQKAILVNSAYPVDSEQDADTTGQEYWTPDVGWGELDLAAAYQHRGDWRIGTVAGAPANNAAFFRVNSQTTGDRTTLTWHRRAIVADYSNLETLAYTTTDLDIYQLTLAGSDNDKDVCGGSTTCGVDLSESSDSGAKLVQPVPGPTGLVPVTGATGPSGIVTKWDATDSATDNVEQVRAKTSGDSIVKVAAASTVDGESSEDFALASTQPLVPLSTPTIDAPTPGLSDDTTPIGQSVTVQANFTNESSGTDLVDGLDLNNAQVTIDLPAGVALVAGSATQTVGTLSTGETESATWTIQSTTSGAHDIAVTAQGQRFGTTFKSTAPAATLTADSVPPVVSLVAPSSWQPQKTSVVSWDATDTLTNIASVSVQKSIDGQAWQSVYSGSQPSGSAHVSAEEGQSVAVRVQATDELGNNSAWTEGAWKVDAEPPAISLAGPASVPFGSPATFPVSATNTGSPIVTAYRTGWDDAAPLSPLIGQAITLPSVKGIDRVEVVVTDGLGRSASSRVTVASTPRPTKLSAQVLRKAGRANLAVRVTPAADGYVDARLRCRGRRARVYVYVHAGRGSARLSKRDGRCSIAAEFRPNRKQEFARSKARVRASLAP